MHHPHGHLVCRHQRCGIDCMLGCFQQLSRCGCGNQHRYASGPTTTSREYGVRSSRKRMRARKQSLGARRFVFPPSLRLEGAVPVLGTGGGAETIPWRETVCLPAVTSLGRRGPGPGHWRRAAGIVDAVPDSSRSWTPSSGVS